MTSTAGRGALRPRRRRLALGALGSVAAVTAAIVIPSSGAIADETENPITEYGPVPARIGLVGGIGLPSPLGGVCEVESDGNGKLWIEQYISSEITSYDLATGEYESFPTPQPLSVPGGMDKDGQGHFWMTGVTNNSVIRISTADGSYQQWQLPWANALSTSLLDTPLNLGLSLSNDVAWGPDNALWMTLGGLNAIGRFDPATQEFTKYDVPGEVLGQVHSLFGIIKPGPGRTILFNLPQMNKVGTIDVDTKEIKQYEMPTPLSWPTGIRTAHDGMIWVGQGLGMNLAKVNPTTGEVTEYPLLGVDGLLTSILDGLEIGSIGNPVPTLGPVVEGRDHNIYALVAFASPATLGNQILRFNPRTEEVVMWPTPSSASYPCDINPDEHGNLWTGELVAQKISKIEVPPATE
jgi:virginiamycin B lyase